MELNFKLCIQLKEAGFPQTFKEHSWAWSDKESIIAAWPYEGEPDGRVQGMNFVAKIPSLEELIEETVKLCKNEDFHLEHLGGDGWQASSCFWVDETWIKGNSAKEAVANLFLSLRK